MISFFGAILQHIFKVFAFKHSGEGLPTSRGPALYMLIAHFFALSLLEQYVSTQQAPSENALVSFALVAILLLVMLRPVPASLVLLCYIGSDILLVLSSLVPDVKAREGFTVLISIWGLAAMVTAMIRYGKRRNEELLAQKKKDGGTNNRKDTL